MHVFVYIFKLQFSSVSLKCAFFKLSFAILIYPRGMQFVARNAQRGFCVYSNATIIDEWFAEKGDERGGRRRWKTSRYVVLNIIVPLCEGEPARIRQLL